MRKNLRTIELAFIRRQIREAIKWYKVDNGTPHFWTTNNHKRSKRVEFPAPKDAEFYYTKSDRAIKEIAEKIYNRIYADKLSNKKEDG